MCFDRCWGQSCDQGEPHHWLCSTRNPVAKQIINLSPLPPCILASLFSKFKSFTKISRCLFFLILCSRNLLRLFDLPTEVVPQLSKVFFIISSCSVISCVLNSCSAFLLLSSSFARLPGMPREGGVPGNLLIGTPAAHLDPVYYQLPLESLYDSPSPSLKTGAQGVKKEELNWPLNIQLFS